MFLPLGTSQKLALVQLTSKVVTSHLHPSGHRHSLLPSDVTRDDVSAFVVPPSELDFAAWRSRIEQQKFRMRRRMAE